MSATVVVWIFPALLPTIETAINLFTLSRDFEACRKEGSPSEDVYFYGLRDTCARAATCADGPWSSFLDLQG
jgi:hypothetical protein